METKETKKCPYCGGEILAVATKCKHCRKWLPKDEEPKETPQEEQPEQTPVEPEAAPQSKTQELPKPETRESPTVTPSETVQEDIPTETPSETVQEDTPTETPSETVQEDTPTVTSSEIVRENTPTETPQDTLEQPREKKSKRGYLLFAAIGVVLLLGVIWFLTSSQNYSEKADKLRLENKFDEATALYQKAAENNDAYGMWRLAKAYGNGDGIEFSQEKALEWLKKAADNGSEEALSDLATAYLYGSYGLSVDSLKGVNTIKQLLQTSNNPYALSRCSGVYAGGYGKYFEIDYDEVFKVLQKVTDKENSYYNYMMGFVYLNGTSSIDVDANKAIEYFEKAYQEGNGNAAYRIGALYADGKMLPKDYKKAIEWYNKGIEKNSTISMTGLSWIYDTYNQDTKDFHDDNKAYNLLKNAILHGDGDAYSKLGYYYTVGKCVEKDDQKAFELYKRAAELGSSDGMLNVGVNLLVGRGTAKDVDAAEKMWIKAAERGNEEAAYRLANCYLNSTFKGNTDKVVLYMNKAAALNHPEACYKLACYYHNGIDGYYPKDDFQAFIYMKKAADLGNIEACAGLGYMYENGIGCEKNLELAKEYKAKAGITN